MKTKNQIASELKATALAYGLKYSFKHEGRMWQCLDIHGKSIWAGTLRDMRKLAVGKPVV